MTREEAEALAAAENAKGRPGVVYEAVGPSQLALGDGRVSPWFVRRIVDRSRVDRGAAAGGLGR